MEKQATLFFLRVTTALHHHRGEPNLPKVQEELSASLRNLQLFEVNSCLTH